MLLNILVAKEAESNYLLMQFTDDTKLRDIINTKKVESHHKRNFLHKTLKHFGITCSVLLTYVQEKQN